MVINNPMQARNVVLPDSAHSATDGAEAAEQLRARTAFFLSHHRGSGVDYWTRQNRKRVKMITKVSLSCGGAVAAQRRVQRTKMDVMGKAMRVQACSGRQTPFYRSRQKLAGVMDE